MTKKITWGKLRLYLAIGFVILLWIVAEMTGLREEFSLTNLKEVFNQNIYIASIIYIGLFTIGNLLFIPGWIFLAGTILVLGHVHGYLLTYVAAITSCVMSFLIIRLIGGDSLRGISYNWAKKVLNKLDQYPIRVVVILRVCMATSPPLNYSLALTGLKFRKYLVGSMIGLPIPILFYAVFIDQLIAQLN